MKINYLTRICVMFIASMITAPVFATVEGTWRTQKSKAGAYMDVQITKCGENFCGKAAKIYHSKTPPPVGTVIIKDMKRVTDKFFNNGLIYAPDTKKWYRSKMQLVGKEKLKVSGCVLRILCRTQVWVKQ